MAAAILVKRLKARMGLSTDDDDFATSGPEWLKNVVDWGNPDHRRIVAASLVNAVYLRYRHHKSKGDRPSDAWFTSFGFQVYNLFDEGGPGTDVAPFGIIFVRGDTEDTASSAAAATEKTRAPKYVVAFRGTTNLGDFVLDLKLVFESAQWTQRFQEARRLVQELVEENGGGSRIWLAGHSLGASVATFAGMQLAREHQLPDDTFLFNPPYCAINIECKLADALLDRITTWLQKGLGELLEGLFDVEDPSTIFPELRAWYPNIFTNSGDYISKGFIRYFHTSENGRDAGKTGMLVRVPKQGGGVRDVHINTGNHSDVSLNFIPSADLAVRKQRVFFFWKWVHVGRLGRFLRAHSLEQWWKRRLELTHETHMRTSG